MVRARVLLLLLVPLSALVQDKPDDRKLPSKVRSEIHQLIKEYFARRDWKERDEIVRRVEDLEKDYTVTRQDVASLVRMMFDAARQGPRQTGKSPAQCTHPDFPGHYIINVGGAARSGQKVPLFIGLHGGGEGVGEGSQIAGLFGNPLPNGIVVYPTVIKKEATAWNTEREEQYVLAIIEELKRTYNIDTNRVYLAGHSMGGYGTWSIGGRHADLFAAIQPGAGGVFGSNQGIMRGIVENLKNTPVYFYHGSDDPRVPPTTDRLAAQKLQEYREKYGPYEYVYQEEDGIGHGLPRKGLKPIWDWIFSKKRDPYPEFVIWEPTRPYKKLFYWVKLDPPSGRIEAKIEGNRILIEGSCRNVTLMISDKMGLLDKQVTVIKGGKEVFTGKPVYSIATALESIGAKNDPEMYFIARIRVPD